MSDEQKLWQVTYFNTVLGERCVLVDKVYERTADAVVARFGGNDEFSRLPEVRKELAPATGSAA